MAEDPRIGTVVAGCRLERRLRPGGMSVVYEAQHQHLDRQVAVKLLDERLARDEDYRKRFLRESRLAAGLFHPNIVPVYDAGEVDGQPYLVMHYVEGTDLAELLQTGGALGPERTLSILGQVVNALDAAHERGLVHRDVKPANILIASGEGVEQPGHVYLSDFGLAKQVQSGSRLTKQGLFMGTLDYVAPEQIQGQGVDRRADVYSLACVAYECLTGTVPYPKDSEVAMMYAHLQEAPPSASAARPGLPPAVDAVLARGMAKQVDERYGTCGELLEALREALQRPAEERTPSIVGQVPLAVPAGGGEAAPVPEAAPARPPLVDVLYLDYQGARYGLGRTQSGYAVWDLESGGHPIRLFPLTEPAWAEAWTTYQQLEEAPSGEAEVQQVSGQQEVPAAGSGPTELLVGVVFLDYRGTRYALGRTQDAYGIWDLAAGGYPVQTFGLDPSSWGEAWARYQELETTPTAAAAGVTGERWSTDERPAGAPVAAEPAEMAGAVSVDYRGAGYGLGRTSDAYAIWDLAAGGNPVRTFPLDPASWNEAWAAFQDLEARVS